VTGLATVTAGGGGPPACFGPSPQLTTKVASASATLRRRKVAGITGDFAFLEPFMELWPTAYGNPTLSGGCQVCPPWVFSNGRGNVGLHPEK